MYKRQAPWSPNTKVITDELGDDAQVFVSNADFSDIAADPASWVCMPEYAETVSYTHLA